MTNLPALDEQQAGSLHTAQPCSLVQIRQVAQHTCGARVLCQHGWGHQSEHTAADCMPHKGPSNTKDTNEFPCSMRWRGSLCYHIH
jgi:hypothetical protein